MNIKAMALVMGVIGSGNAALGKTVVEAGKADSLPQVDISDYKVSGSHCRVGKMGEADTTVLVKQSVPGGKKDYFQLTFDAFILQPGHYGNDKDVQSLYGDCLVEMAIAVPTGYQISYIQYQMDGGIAIGQFGGQTKGQESAEIATAFYLETAGPERKWLADGRHSIRRTAPFVDDVEVLESIDLESGSCDTKVQLSMYTTATLESDTVIDSLSEVSIDRSSGKFGQSIRVYLSKCPG